MNLHILQNDPKILSLGCYNAEKSRGIIHTEEWNLKMKDLQEEYNKLNEQNSLRESAICKKPE